MNLNSRLMQLGIRISGGGEPLIIGDATDLEQTLIEAVLQFPEDERMVSLVFSWIKVHGNYVIVEKLGKLAARYPAGKCPAIRWVAALAAYGAEHCSHKWRKLARRQTVPLYLFPEEVTKSAVARKGAIPWLKKLNIIVPEGALRIREDDIVSPEELVKINRQYRNRYLFGPSWRADIITAIQDGMQTPMEISKKLGCSYEPAHRVYQEYAMAIKTT